MLNPYAPSDASILWFSAAMFVCYWLLLFFEPSRPRVRDTLEGAALICVALTSCYGLLSGCFRRAHPATSVARVAAAIGYLGAAVALGFLLSKFTRSLAVLPLLLMGPAVVAVLIDRVISRYAAD